MHSDDPSRYAVRDKTTTAAAVLRGPTSTAPTRLDPFAIRSLERQRSLDSNNESDDDDHHHDHDDDVKNDSDHHLNGGGGGGGGGAVCVKTVATPAVKVAVATTRTTPTTKNDQLRQHKLGRAGCKKAAGSDEGVCREGTPDVSANDDGQEEGGNLRQRPVSATTVGRRPPLLVSNSNSSSSNSSSSTTSHSSSSRNGISSSNISNNSGSSNSSSNKNGISGNSCSNNSGSSNSGSSSSSSSSSSNSSRNNSSSNNSSSRASNRRSNSNNTSNNTSNNNNSSSNNNSRRPRVPAPEKKHIRRVIDPRQNTNMSTSTMTNAGSGSCTTLHLALQTTPLLYDDNNNNAGAVAAAAAASASALKPRGLFNSHDAFGFLVNAPACSSNDTFGLFLDTNPPSLKNAYTDQANDTKGCGSPRSWFDRYAEALERRPLLYKCLTSAVVGTVGDLMAQTAFWARGGDVVWHDKQAMRRTLAVAVDGFCFNAPFLHYMYDAMDQWIPAEEKTSNAIKQIAIDIVVLDPVFAFAFIVTTGVLQGKSVEADIIPTIKADYLSLVLWLMAIGLVFAPPRVYLFHSFPLKWRVLIADGIDLLWTFVAVCSTGRG